MKHRLEPAFWGVLWADTAIPLMRRRGCWEKEEGDGSATGRPGRMETEEGERGVERTWEGRTLHEGDEIPLFQENH